ncbi:YqeG family HAD IIIA-type phosphatase [Candidatus Marinamargulisbacteria bacterium SCGC AG-414-C22]|nr:YqeG family HAD IIIA-type phosphatase [Candidatus Marinamargulisbacteria bacterium SCGC AG-414-C22]
MALFFAFKDYVKLIKDLCVPNEVVEHVWDIDIQKLKKQGFTDFILDVDNTILSVKQRNVSLQHMNWIQKCKDLGIKVYILSNNRSKRRIEKVCDQLECPGIYQALKPFSFSYNELQQQFKFNPTTTVVIGDQVFKDIILANWKKAYGILVKPIDDILSPIHTLQYHIEQFLLKKFAVFVPFDK